MILLDLLLDLIFFWRSQRDSGMAGDLSDGSQASPVQRRPGNHFLRKKGLARPRWIPYGTPVRVHGVELNGLVYLGSGARLGIRWRGDPSFVDTDLPVDASGGSQGVHGIETHTAYGDLHPQARARYLEWLAGGCSDEKASSGFALLCLHGLERRFLFDEADEDDRFHIRIRARRLWNIHGRDFRVRPFLSGFLEVASLYFPQDPFFFGEGVDRKMLPIPLRVEIGKRIRSRSAVPGSLMYAWLAFHPDRLVPASLLGNPFFRSRFEGLFAQRFPDGIRFDLPPQQPPVRYMALSGNIRLEFRDEEGVVPDISGIDGPVKQVLPLVEEARSSLEDP